MSSPDENTIEPIGHKNFVLILGAGASVPYGFPLGRQLLETICSAAFLHNFQTVFGDEEGNLQEFFHVMSRFGVTSVDAFLEQRPAFTEVGKLCMALALIPLEEERMLFAGGNKVGQNWYQALGGLLRVGEEEWESSCPVAVITLNYDRSLEHCFTERIRVRRDCSPEEAYTSLCRGIPIVHPHGMLGEYYPGRGREYSIQVSVDTVRTAAQGVRIIGEANDKDPEFVRARELVREAMEIVFVGFGFHRLNVERLLFDDGKLSVDPSCPLSTTLNLPQRDRNRMAGWLPRDIESLGHGAEERLISESLADKVDSVCARNRAPL